MAEPVSIDIRSAMLDYAFRYIYAPYYWGGNGPVSFDCSGFVIAVLQKIGRWPQGVDDTAAGIYGKFKKSTVPKPYKGCLAFYNGESSEINHVVICINSKAIIGANGRDIRRVSVEPIDYRRKRYNLNDLVAYCDPLPGVA